MSTEKKLCLRDMPVCMTAATRIISYLQNNGWQSSFCDLAYYEQDLFKLVNKLRWLWALKFLELPELFNSRDLDSLVYFETDKENEKNNEISLPQICSLLSQKLNGTFDETFSELYSERSSFLMDSYLARLHGKYWSVGYAECVSTPCYSLFNDEDPDERISAYEQFFEKYAHKAVNLSDPEEVSNLRGFFWYIVHCFWFYYNDDSIIDEILDYLIYNVPSIYSEFSDEMNCRSYFGRNGMTYGDEVRDNLLSGIGSFIDGSYLDVSAADDVKEALDKEKWERIIIRLLDIMYPNLSYMTTAQKLSFLKGFDYEPLKVYFSNISYTIGSCDLCVLESRAMGFFMEHDRDYFNDIPIEIKNNLAVFYDALNAYYPAETIFPYTKDYRTAGNSLVLNGTFMVYLIAGTGMSYGVDAYYHETPDADLTMPDLEGIVLLQWADKLYDAIKTTKKEGE